MNSGFKRWLFRQTANPAKNFAMLGVGFVIFFLGILLLGIAEYGIQSSIWQEILAVIAILVIAIGCIIAAMGYISLSLLRILRIINEDNNKQP